MSHPGAILGFGLASIGIGLAEILMPHRLEKMMGMEAAEYTGVLRVLGVREIMVGVDILSHQEPAPGLWSRTAGDAMDLVILGVAARNTRKPAGLATAFAMVAAVGALDMICAKRLTSHSV